MESYGILEASVLSKNTIIAKSRAGGLYGYTVGAARKSSEFVKFVKFHTSNLHCPALPFLDKFYTFDFPYFSIGLAPWVPWVGNLLMGYWIH